MGRQEIATGVLLGIALGASLLAYKAYQDQRENMQNRPEAGGEVGFVTVYADHPNRGRIPLRVGQRYLLARPHELGLAFDSKGEGPRSVRIEAVTEATVQVLEELELFAPSDQQPLEKLVRLDKSMPTVFDLVVTLEAPHARALISTYPIRLEPLPDAEKPAKAADDAPP